MIARQTRATNSINKVFKFSECHSLCGCSKDSCKNYLMAAQKKFKCFQLEIRRIQKKDLMMWGLFTLEDIPQGAFVCQYRGEIVTKKQGDMRGSFYDSQGLSYLFDMNDPEDDDELDSKVQ